MTERRNGAHTSPTFVACTTVTRLEDVGWNVTETATRPGYERGTLSRLLNGKAGVSANMAPALEDIGRGTSAHRMRMQASYELAKARRGRAAAQRYANALHGRCRRAHGAG